jgi:hypothetical protein
VNIGIRGSDSERMMAAELRYVRGRLKEAEDLLREETDECLCIMTPIKGTAGANIKQENLCPKGQECWWCRVRKFLGKTK